MATCEGNREYLESPEEVMERIQARAEAHLVPLRGLIELTFRCPLRCIHCYGCEDGLPLPMYDGRRELAPDEWKRVLDETAEAGCLDMTFSGGEILAYEGWHGILEHAVRRAFAVTLFTGGTLIDEDAAGRIAGLGVIAVELTLHAMDRAVFESVTRVPGSFDRMMRGIELLRRRGVPLVLKCVLMRPNAGAYREVAAFARAVGARLRYALDLSPRNDGNAGPMGHRIGIEQMEAYYRSEVPAPWGGLEKVPPEVMRDKAICAAGTTAFAVNPYGDVFACNQLLIPVGNVREDAFRGIWFDRPSEFLRRVRAVRTFADLPACAGCALSYACRRCHGIAHLETGDFLAASPSACAMAAFVERMNGEAVTSQDSNGKSQASSDHPR